MRKLLAAAIQGAFGAGSNNRVEMCIARCVDIGGNHPVQCKQSCQKEAEEDGEEDQ